MLLDWQKSIFKKFQHGQNDEPLIFEIGTFLNQDKPGDPMQYIKTWLLSHPSQAEKLQDQKLLDEQAEFIYKLFTGKESFPAYCNRIYKKL